MLTIQQGNQITPIKTVSKDFDEAKSLIVYRDSCIETRNSQLATRTTIHDSRATSYGFFILQYSILNCFLNLYQIYKREYVREITMVMYHSLVSLIFQPPRHQQTILPFLSRDVWSVQGISQARNLPR